MIYYSIHKNYVNTIGYTTVYTRIMSLQDSVKTGYATDINIGSKYLKTEHMGKDLDIDATKHQ